MKTKPTFEKKDKASDKKQGLKETSKKDSTKDMMQQLKTARNMK